MLISPPPPGQDFGFYNGYVSSVKDTDLVSALQANLTQLIEFYRALSEEQLQYRYAPGKWSIKEMLQHLIDAERNFSYRIMRISRNDQGHLPAYDIHQFTLESDVADKDVDLMINEWEHLRKAAILMFENMSPSLIDRTGPARDLIISVRALGFAMVGHVIHHMNMIREKYLPAIAP